ncbi:N-acetylglucosamine-6-phosphate deacetylase [Glaciecola sp. SC05]|uniref:N-acetylglucosamine-6-phosphate deacetylase n=1 Tax=Glaciecola sp. SC05 TaxID=1987355 RepID=UPI00352957A6
MKTYLTQHLFDGVQMHRNMHLQVDEGLIVAILPASTSPLEADESLDGLVCAGFIDTQVNGGGGVLFNHEPSFQSLQTMMRGHTKFGTTTMLPTLITDSGTIMQKAATAVKQAIETSLPGIAGMHFEGPHLSLAKKGIHPSEHVRSISDVDLMTFTRSDIGKVMITIAPENVPPDIITDLVKHGVVVSLGHSAASFDLVQGAIEAGAIGFTHLFNAMSGLTAREPGMIASALTDPRIFAGLIADLHHVHPINCKLAYHCIGPSRLMLVTDAMAHVGSDMQSLPWLDSTITKVGNKLVLEDGSIAGSCLDMAGAVKNMFDLLSAGLPDDQPNDVLSEVLNMASQVPANMLSLSDRGELKPGNRADFVLLNDDLQVKACWIDGKVVFDHLT